MFAQKKQLYLSGKVKDSSGFVKDIHVFNLTKKTGTFTNDYGSYNLFVSLGDTIQFTSIQHLKKQVIISKRIMQRKRLDVYLINNSIVLDEVFIKTTELLGVLTSDVNKTPIDKRKEALKKNMNLSKVDWNASVKDDYIDEKVRPPIKNTDPTMAFIGAGASAYIPFKYSKKLWALRRDIAFKQDLPQILLNKLGTDFFLKELKIPREKYLSFVFFCQNNNLEKVVKQDSLITLIDYLKDESKLYLNSYTFKNDE